MTELRERRCTVLLHFIGVFLPFCDKGAVTLVFGVNGRVKRGTEVVDVDLNVSCVQLLSCRLGA